MRGPRLLLLALLAGASVAPARSAAQTGPQPNLVLTLAAGVVDGAALWTIPRQPFCPVYSGGTCNAPADTLRLAREQGSSITIGAAVSYFPGPSVGIQAEMAYLGLPLRDACALLNSSPPPTTQSQQLCANMQGASHSTGAISFVASALVRAAARHQLSPYQVLVDDSPQRLALSFVAGAGFTVALGPAYQFRFEARDAIARFERVTGASDASLLPPTGTKFFHHFVLTMGLDVVLEQKRGRRY